MKNYDNMTRDELSYLCGYRYSVCDLAIKALEILMDRNEYFKFNEPVPGYGSYDIYAIANVKGVIMAEYIRFSTKHKGGDKHELGTKGTESPIAMMIAVEKYKNQEGISEIHPEYEDWEPILCI